jgi:mannose-6-phosphate isomerase-like protein (cupin superfamily)
MKAPAAPFVGRHVDKPWGHEFIWAETDRYAGKTLYIQGGGTLSFQYHERKDETLHLFSGLLDLEIQRPGAKRETVRLLAGESVHIPAGCRHRMRAIEPCIVLEVSTPELDDVVRLEDEYGRAGK